MFLNPLGLLALAAVPVVVGLHLFRRRFQPRVVSAVFLWAAQDRSPVAGRKREPLHRSASFWCEVLAALLLALAFAGLRAFGAGEAQHLVVVLDSSASMAAISPDGPIATAARTVVEERIDELPRGSRVTIVQSGTRPELLVGPAAFVREATQALAEWEPGEPRHPSAPAIALAQQLAGEETVLFVTDHMQPNAWPEGIEAIAVGQPTPNFAFTHASRRRTTDEETRETVERVHLSISSFTDQPRTIDVALFAGEAPLDSRRVELAPGERKHVGFRIPTGSPVLSARLPDDGLAVDNEVWLAPEPPRTLAIASTLPDELSVHVGLMTPGQEASNIDRWLDLVPDAIDAKTVSAAHVVLSTGVPAGSAWCLSFPPSEADERKALVGPFLIDKRSSLLEGVTLDGIVWSLMPDVELLGAPLVTAGDVPLITEGRVGDRRIFQANLDLVSSSLHRSPDWPILLTNLAEARRRELPGPARASLAIGETFVYRDRNPATYLLTGPETRELRALGTLAVEDVTQPGVYTLSRTTEQEPVELCKIAYSFSDATESDLRDATSGERAGRPSEATLLAGFTWLEIVLIVLTLALIGLDWFVLSSPKKRRREAV
ncbi:MAG: VWA domain-containing protein [bacterium]|nr:VWA domain-containing protein [bacterium]